MLRCLDFRADASMLSLRHYRIQVEHAKGGKRAAYDPYGGGRGGYGPPGYGARPAPRIRRGEWKAALGKTT